MIRAAVAVELHQDSKIGIGDGTPVSAAGQGGKNFSRARIGVGRLGGTANENAATAGCVARSRDFIRAADRDASDVGLKPGIAAGAKCGAHEGLSRGSPPAPMSS